MKVYLHSPVSLHFAVLRLSDAFTSALSLTPDSSVSIATRIRDPFPARARVLSLLGRTPATYPVDTGGSLPGGNSVGAEADQSLPSSTEVKN